ncbi:MAG TPA: hypothetical protein DGT21_11425, partial [Armatimonadetes bacterium]|nr:hypothetical protein [Armatimonadota bacterium]
MTSTDFVLPPYPFEQKAQAVFGDLTDVQFTPTGIGREVYLDLAERIVRAAVPWQDERGAIINPVLKRETS